MKLKLPYFILVFLALAIPSSLQAEYRVFTSRDGKEIQAEVINIRGKKVKIRREDGKVFAFDIELLSEEDQEYLNLWKEEAAANVTTDFEFECTKKRISHEKKRAEAREVTVEEWIYEVTATNRSDGELTDLTIRYRIYARDNDFHSDRQSAPLRYEEGEKAVPSLAKLDDITFNTIPITTEKERMDANWRIVGSSKTRVRDEVVGCWFRVYRGEQRIFEHKSNAQALEAEKWEE